MSGGVRTTAYVVSAVVMAVLDAAWITLVASDLYRDQLGDVVAASPRWAPAIGFYLVFWFALCHFVVLQALTLGHGWARIVRDAALLGLTAYATWALTAWAVLAPFTALVAVSDLLWGPVMATATAAAAVAVARRRHGRVAS